MTVGYSGKPLGKKLGIKAGMTVVVLDAPVNYAELIEPIPEGAVLLWGEYSTEDTLPKGRVSTCGADIVHIFTNGWEELFHKLIKAKSSIKQDRVIWVSWYKKAAKLPTEITGDTIREAALPLGLVDVKVCAVN
jgi:hypothetical protein